MYFSGKFAAGMRRCLTLCLSAAWVAVPRHAVAQTQPRPLSARLGRTPSPLVAAAVPADTASALLQMGSRASTIFSGHVEAVSRNDAAGFVDVRFRIDQPLRGCPQTGVYVLREWAGLWSGHAERYRVGQRLLMLLPRRGPSGMSAPVGGLDGAIPITATGAEPLADGNGVAPADDGAAADPAASLGVDLRWVAARVARGTAPKETALRAISGNNAIGRPVLPSPADPTGEGWGGPVAPLHPASSSGSPVTPVPVNLGSVLSLLRGTDGPR